MSKKRGKQHLKKNSPSLREERQRKAREREIFEREKSREQRQMVNFYDAALTVDADERGILTTPAEPVGEITDEIRELCVRLLWVVERDPNCLGVAAPQVGVSLRLFSMQESPGVYWVWINPEVTVPEGALSVMEYEGCFSIPDQKVPITRSTAVRVRALAPDGSEHERVFTGRAARVVQHEVDHLNGVLLSDHGALEPVTGDVIATGEEIPASIVGAEKLAEELLRRRAPGSVW